MNEQQRVDTLEKHFKPIEILELFSNILLWISVAMSFVIFYLDNHPDLKGFSNVVFIVITVLYFIISNYSTLFLSRQAQNKRVTNLISNSYAVSLDDEVTNLYYNNYQSPSITRLGINVFENSLFSKAIATKMLKRERVKIIILLVVWFVLMSNRNTSLELLSIIAQTLLTTTLVTNYVKLEILKHGFDNIFDSCRRLFLAINNRDDLFTSQILEIAFRYEILKASMGTKLSSRVFNEINESTTREWERIKGNLNLQ